MLSTCWIQRRCSRGWRWVICSCGGRRGRHHSICADDYADVASVRVNTSVYNLAVTSKTVVFGRDGQTRFSKEPGEDRGVLWWAGDDYLSGSAAA